MRTTVEDMTSADHAFAVPVSDEQLWEMTAQYLSAGIAAGEQVIYFEDGAADALLGRLVDDRVPVGAALAHGQLIIVSGAETRTTARVPAEKLEQMLHAQIDESSALGWPGIRFSGESSSGILRQPGGTSLVEHERTLDRVVRARPTARALCMYSRSRFPEEAIRALTDLHRTEVVHPALYDDTLLRITSAGPAAARLAGEVDHSNRPRIRSLIDATLDRALRSHSAPTDITLDLSSLRFLDVAGAVSLVHAAEEFPSTHRLVLTGVRARVQRVLDRCGAPFAAQLVVVGRPDPDFSR